MSKPKYIRDLRSILEADPQITDIDDLERELYSIGSDRTTVIMLTSFLDQSLRKYLVFSMRQDLNSDDRARIFDYNGFAGALSSKISVAWAFNLIGPIIRSDLEIIKDIRNTFAHSRMSLSFLTEEVSEACKHLKVVELSSAHAPFRYFDLIKAGELSEERSIEHPKTRFVAACHLISYRIHQKVHGPVAGDIAFMEDDILP